MIQVAGRTGERYDVRLSSSLGNLALVTVGDFLRKHPAARGVSAVAGLTLALAGLTAFVVPLAFHWIHVDPGAAFRLATPTMILGGALLVAVLFSGTQFSLFVAEPREVEERKAAETEFREARTTDPFAYLDLDSKRLSEYTQ